MTVSAYPDMLPCFSIDPYSYRQGETIQSTGFESGRQRFRRVAKVAPEYFSLAAVFDDEQLAVFEAWVYHELEDIGEFTAKIKTASEGLADQKIRLLSTAFEKTLLENKRWSVSFQVMKKKQNYLDQFALYEKIYGLSPTFGTDTKNALNALWD